MQGFDRLSPNGSWSDPDLTRHALARNLKRIRLERGLSQEELAHRAEIDRTYISALERRVYGVSIDVLGRIAKALDVEPAALLAKPDDSASA